MTGTAPWITYRPELKVLDCTVRDGGLVNDSHFDDDIVRAVYEGCVAAGIDYMEVGYKNSPERFPKDKYGPWRHCEEEDLNRVFAGHSDEETGLKLSAMADAGGKSDWRRQIVPCEESVLGLIRVACYVHEVSEAIDMVHHAHSLGYETTLNVMAISVASEQEIDQALEVGAASPAGTVVVVDSFGNLYREQVDYLVRKYMDAVAGTGKEIGIHAHNNLQLAFANTIEAIILGANRVDASMMGMGRGAGNCPMEILLGFLRNPKFDLRPVLDVIQNSILPLRDVHDWGPSIPYQLTAKMNRHPRAAIEFRAGDDPDDYVAFYDQITADP